MRRQGDAAGAGGETWAREWSTALQAAPAGRCRVAGFRWAVALLWAPHVQVLPCSIQPPPLLSHTFLPPFPRQLLDLETSGISTAPQQKISLPELAAQVGWAAVQEGGSSILGALRRAGGGDGERSA